MDNEVFTLSTGICKAELTVYIVYPGRTPLNLASDKGLHSFLFFFSVAA